MISLRNLRLMRGASVLIDDATLAIHAGYRVGVVGPNGCGKSSLFALLLGELHADTGDADVPDGIAIAHVGQETPAAPDAALEYVLDGDTELRDVERAIRDAEARHDPGPLAELHERYEAIGGYSARARAATILAGLGFPADRHDVPVAEFSGGFRMRLNLARALVCRSDLLLLDEPTNHLDLDAVIWLEAWLRSYRGTLLLVSHDREFLDGVVTHIVHFDQCRLRLYKGYSDFERARAQALAVQNAAYERQQREIAHLHSFIERFRAKATKARQAQSRIKMLERLEEIVPAHADAPFHFEFRAFAANPSPLLALEDVAAGYAGRTVLAGIRLSVLPGMRIGLLGRNGAGKSTFIRALAGMLAPSGGSIRAGKGLAIGYFAQHQLEQLDPAASPLLHLMRLDAGAREQDLRGFLGGFGFAGDQALAPAGPFSGGEKARLALALIVYQRPNLLLLDEPTNHLDIEMRHALTVALQEFEGAVVLVSHDRHLLKSTVDEFLLVDAGQVAPFAGDLDDYRRWLESGGSGDAAPVDASVPSRRDQRRQEAERRADLGKLLRPLEADLRKVESELDRVTREKAAIDGWLASEEAYRDEARGRLRNALVEQGELAARLGEVEERWLELQERIEAIRAG